MNEQAVVFGKVHPLIGVITDPPRPADDDDLPVIILPNAGLVNRVGPSRLFVKMARRLAELGFVVARFDHSGIGDSEVRRDKLPFEQSSVQEVQQVMDELAESRGAKRFVLVGLCSAAVTSFRTAGSDRRVVGAVLINPQGFVDDPQWHQWVTWRNYARAYWTRSLFSFDCWRRAFTGRIQYRRLLVILALQVKNWFSRPKTVTSIADRLASELRDIGDRGVRLLFVFSKLDTALDYVNAFLDNRNKRLMRSGQFQNETVGGTDHTFTLRRNQQHLVNVLERWAVGQKQQYCKLSE